MQDFLIDNETYDLLLVGGDVVLGESSLQHQLLLLVTNKGDWKEQPPIGVSAPFYLKDENENGLLSAIKQEFEKDGMQVKSVTITKGKINIDAAYSN